MPRGFSKFAAAGFGTCLILLCVVFGLGTLHFNPPDPLGADAASDLFSATRARDDLARLLGDETPHPVGSAANMLVKGRIVARLTELGLVPEVQDAIVCSFKWPVCGHVQNVLAKIDGQQRSGILMMAHYDSVPNAPGAGDDGAGVATLLEIARALRDAPTPRNSVLFAFTDGEEPGLLGADAFFSQHAWAGDVAAVINIEGSGSEGPSLLLRSGPRSGVVLDAFRSVAEFPVASSFSEELFKRLPNDTDLSVANHAGKPGVDIAFVGERNHYHSPADSVANLSLATLQHHGENALPLLRALADADLSKDAPNYVYAAPTQSLWLAYRAETGLAISICIIALLGLATWRRWQGPGHFFAALGIVVLVLATIVVFEMAMLETADLLAGTRVAWPANPWPWLLIIYATPIVALALQRPLVRRVGFWNTLLAAWWFWSLLTLGLAWYLPLASHLTLPPTVVATLVIVVLAFAHPLDRPVFRCCAAIINAVVAGVFVLPLAYMGENTQGLTAAPVIFVPLALLAVTLLPLLDRGRVKMARWIAVVVVLVGVAWTHWVSLYSEKRPQRVNFTYVFDADKDRANYVAWSPNPLPAGVSSALPFVTGPSPLVWETAPAFVAPGEVMPREALTFDPVIVAGSTRTLRLHPTAQTDMVILAIPKSAPIASIRVDGHPIGSDWEEDGDYRMIGFVAPPPGGVSIELDTTAPDSIEGYLIDTRFSLPDSSHALVDARGQLAAPGGHDGDRWIVFRRVKI